jgi:hypothetical protein
MMPASKSCAGKRYPGRGKLAPSLEGMGVTVEVIIWTVEYAIENGTVEIRSSDGTFGIKSASGLKARTGRRGIFYIKLARGLKKRESHLI